MALEEYWGRGHTAKRLCVRSGWDIHPPTSERGVLLTRRKVGTAGGWAFTPAAPASRASLPRDSNTWPGDDKRIDSTLGRRGEESWGSREKDGEKGTIEEPGCQGGATVERPQVERHERQGFGLLGCVRLT